MGRKVLFLLVVLTMITVIAFSAAQAFRVTSQNQLLMGPAADGKIGDYVLKNDKVAFLIGDKNNYHGYMKSGGNVLDAVYNGGEDEFDEFHTYFGWPKQAIYDKIQILSDGSNGSPAVLKLTGHHSDIPGVSIVTSYTLYPGKTYLVVSTTLVNNSGKDIPKIILGDASFFGYAKPFTFGLGYKVSHTDTQFIGAQGDDIAYGFTTLQLDSTGKMRKIHISYIFADPEIMTVALKNGEKVTYQRLFMVGKDISSLLDTTFTVRREKFTLVKGRAFNYTGGSLNNVKINVYNDKGTLYSVSYTDSKGNYSFPALAGKYTLKVDVPGMNTQTSPTIDVKTVGGTLVVKAPLVGQYVSQNQLVWGPYLSDMTQRSVYVNWKSLVPASGEVVIGRNVYKDPNVTTLHHLKITGLTPGRTFFYQVKVNDSASSKGLTSDKYSFSTFAQDPKEFKFVVYSDTRTYNKRHRIVADAIAQEHPAFVINDGDLVMDGRVKSDWNGFFWAVKNMAATSPLYPVLGNHEYNSKYYFSSFVTPAGGGEHNEQYYSFDYGPAHFIVLDADILLMQRDVKGMEKETQWLENDLKSHSNAKWTFVFYHEPFWTNCSEYGNEPVSPTITYWKPIFEKYHVDIVFNSHFHTYERFRDYGIQYIVSGGGGAPLYLHVKKPEDRYPFTVVEKPGYHHYILITVTNNQVKVLVKAVLKQTDKKKEDGFRPAKFIMDQFKLNKF